MSEADVKAVIAKLKKTEPGLVFGVPGYSSEVQPYVGLEAGRLSLIVSGEVEKLSELQSSEAVEVRTRCTDYGEGSIVFTVTDAKYEKLFVKFCDDVLAAMNTAGSPEEAFSFLAARYEKWKAFWRNKRGALGKEGLRGLAGELAYLILCLDGGVPPAEAVRAWRGPEQADQDFVFPDGWTEVKTVGQSACEVKISSLEQLVNPGVLLDKEDVKGRLAIVSLHAEPSGQGYVTVRSLYEKVRERLKGLPMETSNFINSVEMFGVDIEHGHLENTMQMQFMGMSLYDVNKEGFPKLIRTDAMPAAVTKAAYSLSIAAIEPWKIEETSSTYEF